MIINHKYIREVLSSYKIMLSNDQFDHLVFRLDSQQRLIESLERADLDSEIESFALVPDWSGKSDKIGRLDFSTSQQYVNAGITFMPEAQKQEDLKEEKIISAREHLLKAKKPDTLNTGYFFMDIFSGYREKDLPSPAEAVKKSLMRIYKIKDSNIFIRVFEEKAVREAEDLEKKYRYRAELSSTLPLYGTTAAIKDIIAVEGHRMTAGSKVLDFPPTEKDAPVVENLRKAGSVVVGVTNLHELAFGTTNINPHYGVVVNPIDPDFISGGSSGGSAASVKTGLVDFAVGTDTGGSVRIPASCCGIVGFKPSFGLLPISGVFPLGYTLDHIGVLTRSVWEAAVVAEAMLGKYEYFTSRLTGGISRNGVELIGLKVGIPEDFFLEGIQDEVMEGFNLSINTIKEHGAEIIRVDLPYHRYSPACYLCTSGPEALGVHFNRLLEKQNLLGEDVLIRLTAALFIPAYARIRAQRIRKLMFLELCDALKKVDIIATPTLAITVPGINDRIIEINGTRIDVISMLLRNTAPFNLTGVPAITIPCGKDRNGMPIGLQLACGFGEDVKLLKFSITIEKVLNSYI